ncbi:MAG TPA: Flp pilus assembly protein CpaB [Polyangia bacterium]|nr:Flp pilus assembly protein CpaB [Polyangia bacterium]
MSDAPTPKPPSRAGALALSACSLVLASTTGWLVWKLLAAGGPGGELFHNVVVAARSIEAGRPLEPDDLRVVPWPVAALPEGALENPDWLLTPPRVLVSAAAKGEPILRDRLAGGTGGLWLGAIVRPDARAVALRVERDLAAAHFVYPGAHVDVLATFEDPRRRTFQSATLLQDVPVLAVGRYADLDGFRREKAAQGAPSALGSGDEADALVFVQVSPHDAERLSLAQRTGKIDLSVRNGADGGHETTAGASSSELLSAAGPAPEGAALAAADTTEEPAAHPRRRASHSSVASGIRVYHAPPSDH